MIRVGTSGYQYPQWKGRFYPKEMSARKMLAFYSAEFDTVEINSSFYRKPTALQLRGWAAQVPPEFRFAMKAWQRITHHRRLHECAGAVNAFARSARALKERLGPVLYQLPPNLKVDVPLLRDFLRILPGDLRAAFEFRHESWFRDATWDTLRERGAALCIADTDDLLTPVVRTADFGYFRLRRLDYDAAALRRWSRSIRRFEEAYVYFRHEDTALGPRFASALVGLL